MVVKYKYLISLFLVGVIIQVLGAWAKVVHESYANICLTVASVLMILSMILIIIKILTTKNKDSFLNK